MNTWSDLEAAWQGNQGKVDIDALMKAALRARRHLLCRFLGEVLAGVAVMAFWLPFLTRGGVGVKILGGGSVLFVLVWCVLLWRNQRGTWVAATITVDGFLALERRRASASLRWTIVLRRCLLVLCALYVVAAPFVLREGWAIYSQEPWRFLGGTLGFFAIVVGMWIHAGRQRRMLSAVLAAQGTEDMPQRDP
jgi:hypothetical protein